MSVKKLKRRRKGKTIEVDPQILRWRKKYKALGVCKDAEKPSAEALALMHMLRSFRRTDE